MKIAGAALILSASLYTGLLHARTKRQKISCLRDICGALLLMEGELDARLTPMPELICFLAEKTQGQVGAFFSSLSLSMVRLGEEDFASLWRTAMKQAVNFVGAPEMEELCCLGTVLGQYELDKQLSAIRACISVLRTSMEAAQRKYQDDRRLIMGLPAAIGALLIIVLF